MMVILLMMIVILMMMMTHCRWTQNEAAAAADIDSRVTVVDILSSLTVAHYWRHFVCCRHYSENEICDSDTDTKETKHIEIH